MPTTIEWTDETDNIIVVEGGGWWCRMISEGCVNCYAARLNQSDYFKGNHLPYTGDPPKLILRRDLLASWSRQTKPRRHFVASMTDVFGDWVPFEWCIEYLDAMTAAPQQTFQVLTKRANLMRIAVTSWLELRGLNRVPSNIWLGVSVENQKRADERIPELLAIPCVRFLSCEPLIGPLDLLGPSGLGAIDWVIVGGESGPNSRPFNIAWARTIVEQCAAAAVHCFVKQLGAVPIHGEPEPTGKFRTHPKTGRRQMEVRMPLLKLKNHKGGDMAEWPEDLRVREFPKVEVPA